MSMRDKSKIWSVVVLVVLAGQLHADWRTAVTEYWNEYRDWFRNAGALYLNVKKPALLLSPWKAGLSGKFSMGYVPSIPRKYKVVKAVFPVSIYASCGGLGFNVSIEDWIDFGAMRDWLLNYASNVLFNWLIGMIYSNNTVANVLESINRVNNWGLSLQAQKCTRQWVDAFANQEEYKQLSATEKLCVSALYTSGMYSMKEALDECKSHAHEVANNSRPAGMPSWIKELGHKSCYDISDLSPDEKDFFELLFGWFEDTVDVAKDTSGNSYWSPGVDKKGYIVKWHAPDPDSTSLAIIDSTFRRRTYNAFMELMRILGDTTFVGGSPQAEMDSVLVLINEIVLPGSFLSLSLLNDMANLDPWCRVW